MLGTGPLVAAGLVWVGLLFAVALLGQRHATRLASLRPWVYALSLAVYCTSWTFYGTVAQAAAHGWVIPPTFVGTILLFAFALPFLRRLAELVRATNATSLADLIASRLGKSSGLAAVVTAVAVLGMVPYIALQLKAVAQSYALIGAGGVGAPGAAWQDVAFWVALALALFAMLFGTRHAAATEHNPGLVLAMGFESLLKLVAMLIAGGYALALAGAAGLEAPLPGAGAAAGAGGGWLALVLLGALAMFTLPHQFHLGFVELTEPAHLRRARWAFPLYLVLIALPILPLAWAGQGLLGGLVAPDLYVLALPLSQQATTVTVATFLGGLSAATGMVVMAAITLSIMVVNHWVAPAALTGAVGRDAPPRDLGALLLRWRRAAIVALLLLAWGYGRVAGDAGALADFGALSFSALAQLAPAVLAAVYAPRVPPAAVLGGLALGIATWAYLLILPGLLPAGVLAAWAEGRWAVLAPAHFLGTSGWDPLTRGVLLSLSVNGLALLALGARGARARERRRPAVTVATLSALTARFLPQRAVARLFADTRGEALAAPALVDRVEHELAAVVGAASARLLLDAARSGSGRDIEQVAQLVGDAAEASRFSHVLLAAALENMSQGISVVDANLRLVAWNARYAALFDYPPGLLTIGTPVEALVRHNAERGLLGPGAPEALVARRLAHMRAGTPYVTERTLPDGSVIEIRGNPMPGGGFVATFTDVSAFRRAEQALKLANETLEQRVAERTAESEAARAAAERADRAKSRFLAAVSHDLVQPLNAAHLYTHALAQQSVGQPHAAAVAAIDSALTSTEELLAALLDISRLDAGGLRAEPVDVALDAVLAPLVAEARALATARGVRVDLVATRLVVHSDPRLLRRVVQNFLSNAVRYCQRGRVLVGARRRGGEVAIEVWDTGPGIAESDRRVIFEEFRRLDAGTGVQGLGLGLSIAERIARLLGHRLELRSTPGRGSCFAVVVPRVAGADADAPRPAAPSAEAGAAPLAGHVLVVDNDPSAAQALAGLLAGWGIDAACCSDDDGFTAAIARRRPAVCLLDFHLDGGRTALDLIAVLCARHPDVPVVVVTADHGAAVRDAVEQAGALLLHKPVRPLALRSVLNRLLGARHAA